MPRARLLLLAALLAMQGSCTREPPIEKTRIARLPPHYREGTIAIADDGQTYAVVATSPAGDQIVSSHGAEPVRFQALSFVFAPKSHRQFYWTCDKREGEEAPCRLVANGAVVPMASVVPGKVFFSDDGARWAAVVLGKGAAAGEIGAIVLVVDGREVASHPDASAPALSPDQHHLAHLAVKDNRTTLFVDGVVRQVFDAPTQPCAAEAARQARPPDLLINHSVRYLADGSLLTVTRDADGWGIYRDATRLASYPLSQVDAGTAECRASAMLAPGTIRAAERAAAVFWWERIAGSADRWRVVRDGQPIDDVVCSEPWVQHPPEVSADARHVTYACAQSTGQGPKDVFVVIDKQRYGPYRDVWGSALSPNGEHVAYGAATAAPQRPWGVYVDGQARVLGFDSVWRPRISDDGATVAWEAKQDTDRRGILGINDRAIGSFDEVLWGPQLEGDDRVAWVIRRGRQLTRLSVPIALGQPPRRSARVVIKPAPSPRP